MNLYQCTVCGYVHRGEEAPEKCPKCGVGPEKFEKLDDEKASLIEKSRETNEIHMEIFTLLSGIADLAEAGAEINLDPGCFKIFEGLLKTSTEFQQAILAEINGHVKKGKFN
nr:rubredoxin [Vallitalea okinawensis]